MGDGRRAMGQDACFSDDWIGMLTQHNTNNRGRVLDWNATYDDAPSYESTSLQIGSADVFLNRIGDIHT